MDVEMEDDAAMESSHLSITKKVKLNQVFLCDSMDVGSDEEQTEVLIAQEEVDMGSKEKSKLSYDCIVHNNVKDASSSDPGNSTSIAGSVDGLDHQKNSTSGSINSININSSNCNLSCHDNDDDEINDYDCADDASDYDDNDDYLYEDDYLAIQSQFDNVDLPPGVEASLPWLKHPASSGSTTHCVSPSVIPDISGSKRMDSVPDVNGTSGLPDSKSGSASTSSSAVLAELGSNGDLKEENGIIQKFKHFKQFDTVEDFSEHHFNRMGFSEKQPPKNWAKTIQEEWKMLEKGLPDTIRVRVYEARMELLRAVIVGPSGTPYHDGLFVFDCLFPTTYPNDPPMVYYYSGGLRLNPNLYECGKVCLSLLGTWSGRQTEMWIPGKSTMLQVLVSIQALILNAKPFFNEPGYETSYQGAEGDRRSKKYSEDAFIMSLKTMMYTLRKPPKYFEDFVVGHFHAHAHDILVACNAYLNGSAVGSVIVKDGVADIDRTALDASPEFKATLRKMINVLVTNFSRFGFIDCEQFRTNA